MYMISKRIDTVLLVISRISIIQSFFYLHEQEFTITNIVQDPILDFQDNNFYQIC